MSSTLIQVFLGPNTPFYVTNWVDIAQKSIENIAGLYITHRRALFTLALLIVLIIYYLRIIVGVSLS